jgi:hypothetical protein
MPLSPSTRLLARTGRKRPIGPSGCGDSAQAYEKAYQRGALMGIDEVVEFVMELAAGGPRDANQ